MRELGYNGCAIETCCAQDYKLEIFYCDLTKTCEDLDHKRQEVTYEQIKNFVVKDEESAEE